MKKWKAIAVATSVGMITVGGMVVSATASATATQDPQRVAASSSAYSAFSTTMSAFCAKVSTPTDEYPGGRKAAAVAAACPN